MPGKYFDELEVGMSFTHEPGRTVTETDNLLFSALTLNPQPLHLDAEFARSTQHGQILVNSTFTLALVTGLTVQDTSENAVANLAWTDISLPNPVFVGDTLWAESEILDMRESKSNPSVGIVSMRCRGINQRREVVIEYRRTFMVYKREAPEAAPAFPGTDDDWSA